MTSPRSFKLYLALISLSVLAVIVGPSGDSQISLSGSLHRVDFPRREQHPDTSLIILNWSRLPNVIKIISLACQLLPDIIAYVFLWNNSPRKLTYQDFSETGCPSDKLRIYNSAENIYFKARFLACEQAGTTYCFIQDDDYLIWPEILKALHGRLSESQVEGIHLLPAHEKLSSQLLTVQVEDMIHTSFAWLGYGTLLKRSRVVDFLDILHQLNMTEEDFKMADNYFTLLGNSIPETWFDQGVELGGGQPFTVGVEGEERNNRHIVRATKLLDSIFYSEKISVDKIQKFISTAYESPAYPAISRSPCVGMVCVLETSISLLLQHFNATTMKAEHILDISRSNRMKLRKEDIAHFHGFPPSHMVDWRGDTPFRSLQNARKGDWISLDMIGSVPPNRSFAEMVFLVDGATRSILDGSVFEISSDSLHWMDSKNKLVCKESLGPPSTLVALPAGIWHQCSVHMLPIWGMKDGARHFRVRLLQDMQQFWTVYEVWVERNISEI